MPSHPLQPLPPIQRLGWLPVITELLCRCSFPRRGSGVGIFTAGHKYQVTTEQVRVQVKDRRVRRDGITEPIVYTGHELMVRVKDNHGTWHRCLPSPAQQHPLIHDFAFLIEHFDIPEVPDVAALNPKQFRANKRALKALEK